MPAASGPLVGLRVLEFAGPGPSPYCAMLLSDLGAEVLRIDRPGARGGHPAEVISRGRRSVALDLKSTGGREAALRLMEGAEALVEGFQPGAMERLGLGPEAAFARNGALAYGRLTGWGQTGPLAHTVGHDINFISLSGALASIGPPARPAPPLNLVGGFGGGALFLALGLIAAVLHAGRTGKGQVVDSAMSDGAANLMALAYGLNAVGAFSPERGRNIADGGAHFYNAYRCADGAWISIGAIEPAYYAALLSGAEITDPVFADQNNPELWPELTAKLAAVIARRPQAAWLEVFKDLPACVAPVLGLDAAPDHPQNRARNTFVTIAGVVQPAPAPRFSLTPGAVQGPPPAPGQDGAAALADWGLSDDEIATALG